MLASPPWASASASTGPFSPPPTISTSQSRPMPGTIGRRARLSSARPRRLGSGRSRGRRDVGRLAVDDGGGARPRHRGGRDRPARARRGLSSPRSTAHPDAPAHLRPHHARSAPAPRPTPPPARARAGLRRGPLDGVPVSLEGPLRHRRRRHRGAARRCSRGRVPERDAAVLAAATRAGLVCLGKTHLTELAFSVPRASTR